MPRVIQLDPSEAAEARGELIPVGEYFDVVIEDVKEKASQSKDNPGKPMYQVRLRIRDDGPAKGRSLTTTVCLWKGPHFNLVQLNKSIGLPHVDEQGQLLIPDIPELVGQTTAILVKHEEPRGDFDARASVQKFLEQKGAKKTTSRASGRAPLAPPARRPAGATRTPAAPDLKSVPDEAPDVAPVEAPDDNGS